MLLALALAAVLPQSALDVSQASLISSVRRYQPGRPFMVGIRFTMKPNWHVYWRNPGDSGQEARVKWKLPKGWRASAIYWPRPERHTASGMTTYIYPREVVLPVQITPSGPTRDATIGADVQWLVCEEACIAGSKKMSLRIPTGAAALPDRAAAAKIAKAMARTPGGKATGTATKAGKLITLRMARSPGTNAIFLPYEPGVLDHSGKQSFAADGTVKLVASQYFNAKVTKRLRGIVVLESSASSRPVEVDVPLHSIGEKS